MQNANQSRSTDMELAMKDTRASHSDDKSKEAETPSGMIREIPSSGQDQSTYFDTETPIGTQEMNMSTTDGSSHQENTLDATRMSDLSQVQLNNRDHAVSSQSRDVRVKSSGRDVKVKSSIRSIHL